MATEIERKFLVKGKFEHLSVDKTEIIQSYLSIDPAKTIRVRIAGDKAFLTIKDRAMKNSISRNEWEYNIPIAEALDIMTICIAGKIIKTRYLIPAGRHTYEVDVFHDKNEGLVIAEIELSNENEEFEKPEWVGKEVTGLPEYYNANLIK